MPTATGYNGLLGDAGLTLLVNRNPMRRAITRLYRRMREAQEIALTLNGAVAGATATAQPSRVQHSTTELGGARTIETRTIVNRTTTAADEAAIDDDLAVDSQPTYPADGAGNWPHI